jgi:hypothetical protein
MKTRFYTNRELLRNWIDHVLYNTEGIDDYWNIQGTCLTVERLDKMNDNELLSTYTELKTYVEWLETS